MGKNIKPILQFDSKEAVRKAVCHHPFHVDSIFLFLIHLAHDHSSHSGDPPLLRRWQGRRTAMDVRSWISLDHPIRHSVGDSSTGRSLTSSCLELAPSRSRESFPFHYQMEQRISPPIPWSRASRSVNSPRDVDNMMIPIPPKILGTSL
jgi:hypothetical protein